MSSDLVTFARDILARQPFSALLGTTLESFTEGHATLAVPLRGELTQQHGLPHGGVLAYLADNALTFAGGSVLGDSLTVEMKVNYVRAVRDAARLVAVADVVSSGRSQAVCRCDVFAESATGRVLVAAAQGTIQKVRPDAG